MSQEPYVQKEMSMEKTIVVESLEEMDRLEREGIIKPTVWERIAMCLIESNRRLDRIIQDQK